MPHLGPGMKSLFKAWGRPEPSHDALLRQLPLFHTLTRRERGILGLILHERSYVADEIVFEEGEEGLGMYIVVEGGVKATIKGSLLRFSGRAEVGTLAPGDTFGEMALLEGVTRAATIIATESPTRLLSLFQPELLRLLQSHPRIGQKICYELACGLSRRFRALIHKDPASALHH